MSDARSTERQNPRPFSPQRGQSPKNLRNKAAALLVRKLYKCKGDTIADVTEQGTGGGSGDLDTSVSSAARGAPVTLEWRSISVASGQIHLYDTDGDGPVTNGSINIIGQSGTALFYIPDFSGANEDIGPDCEFQVHTSNGPEAVRQIEIT